MKPVAIVYVTNMERSVDWYRRAFPAAELVSTSPFWTEFDAAGGTFALHVTSDVERGTQLGLAFTADRSLEAIVSDWDSFGIEPSRGVEDEPFGRSVVITDPDDLSIQINEHRSDPDS